MLVIDKKRREFRLDKETVLYCVTPSNMELILLSQRYSKDGKMDPKIFGGEDYAGQAEFILDAMKLFVVGWTGVIDSDKNAIEYSPELLPSLPIECFPRFVEEVLNPAFENITSGVLEKNSEAT